MAPATGRSLKDSGKILPTARRDSGEQVPLWHQERKRLRFVPIMLLAASDSISAGGLRIIEIYSGKTLGSRRRLSFYSFIGKTSYMWLIGALSAAACIAYRNICAGKYCLGLWPANDDVQSVQPLEQPLTLTAAFLTEIGSGDPPSIATVNSTSVRGSAGFLLTCDVAVGDRVTPAPRTDPGVRLSRTGLLSKVERD